MLRNFLARHKLSLGLSVWLGLVSTLVVAASTDGVPQLPEPHLEAMEPAVRAQLRAARARALAALETERAGEALGALGRLYQFYALDDSAEIVLRLAAERAPEVADWQYHLGVLYQQQRRLDEAALRLDRVLALEPGDVAAILRRAEVARLNGDTDLAVRLFERVLQRQSNPAHVAAAHLGLARTAIQAPGQEPVEESVQAEEAARQAIEHFRAALELQPDATAVAHELGLAWRRLGERDEARRYLQRAREGGHRELTFPDPRMDELEALATGAARHVRAASRALRAGEVDSAVDHFRQALEVDPHHLPARQGLAAALSRGGDLEAAEIEYRKVLEQAPDVPGVWYALGNVLGRLERTESAIEALRSAIDLVPEHRDAHFNLGLLLARAGDLASAQASFARVLELDPQDGAAHRQLAAVLQRLGRPQEAAQQLEAWVAAHPDDVESRNALAALYAQRGAELGAAGQLKTAAAAFDRAVDLQPSSVQAHFGRFTSLLLASAYAEARRAVEQSRGQLSQAGIDTLPFDHALARLLATCPDATQRDGAKALDLALTVFQARPRVDHGETVAMAFAELGRFEEAVRWQLRVMQQLQLEGRDGNDIARRRLEAYRAGRAVRAPWTESP